jgi:hypothetical protein
MLPIRSQDGDESMKEGWPSVGMTDVKGAASRNTITRRPFDESEVFFQVDAWLLVRPEVMRTAGKA